MKYGQPMISRETRRLLITIALSVAALWVLGRIRFQDQPGPAATVAPVLAQLRPPVSFADLAQTVADLRPIVRAAVVSTGSGSALRFGAERALTVSTEVRGQPLALDRATGLTIVAVPRAESAGVMPWVPRVIDVPRYFVVAERGGDEVALRPAFVSSMSAVASPAWRGEIWKLAPGTIIAPGRFIFTVEGAFVGVSVSGSDGSAIVPASLLLTSAERLSKEPLRRAGTLGVTVQSVTPALAAVADVRAGVIVSAVDPEGPVAGVLMPTDVIQAIDGIEVESIEDWRARVARVGAGDVVSLRVSAEGATRDLQITVAALAPPAAAAVVPRLGLKLTAEPKNGVRITSVEPHTSADHASLLAGDIITAVGRELAPTPARFLQAYTSLPPDGSMIVAFRRGSEHHLAVLSKAAGTVQP
jgi:hypothetical protein